RSDDQWPVECDGARAGTAQQWPVRYPQLYHSMPPSRNRYRKRYGLHHFVLFHHAASLITGEGARVRRDWSALESREVSRRWGSCLLLLLVSSAPSVLATWHIR